MAELQKHQSYTNTELSEDYSILDVKDTSIRSSYSENVLNSLNLKAEISKLTSSESILALESESTTKHYDASTSDNGMSNQSTPNENISENNNAAINQINSKVPLELFIFNKVQEIPGVKDELIKVQEARKKFVPILKSIKEAIDNNLNNLFSLDEDLERIKLRTMEFASRFKRNYFYRTKCQLQEIRCMDSNPLTIKKKSQLLLLIQKLSIAHQNGLNALQVLEKQITKISVIGFMQELLLSFFCSIFELMYMLKPFIGNIKTGDFDEGERIILETIKIIRGLNSEDLLTLFHKLNNNESNSQNVNKTGKSKGKLRLRKVERQLRNSLKSFPNTAEKSIEKDSSVDKEILYMMMMKQRPGAIRRSNFLLENEPKTMVQLMSENEKSGNSSGITLEPVSSLETNISGEGLFAECQQSSFLHKQKKSSQNFKAITSNKDGGLSIHRDQRYSLDEVWSKLIDFRNEIKKYKKTNTVYNKKSLQTMTKMAEKIMQETFQESIQKITSKINVKDFLTLKKKLGE